MLTHYYIIPIKRSTMNITHTPLISILPSILRKKIHDLVYTPAESTRKFLLYSLSSYVYNTYHDGKDRNEYARIEICTCLDRSRFIRHSSPPTLWWHINLNALFTNMESICCFTAILMLKMAV